MSVLNCYALPLFGVVYSNPWEALYQHEAARLERFFGRELAAESIAVAEWADAELMRLYAIASGSDDLAQWTADMCSRRTPGELDRERHTNGGTWPMLQDLERFMQANRPQASAVVDVYNRGEANDLVCVHGLSVKVACSDCDAKTAGCGRYVPNEEADKMGECQHGREYGDGCDECDALAVALFSAAPAQSPVEDESQYATADEYYEGLAPVDYAGADVFAWPDAAEFGPKA